MIIILGKTCSGKSTIQKELIRIGFEPLVTYTTRPPRDGEINGVDYNFMSEDEFLEKVKNEEFAEYTYYETLFGRWYYGSLKKDITSNKVVVLNPSGLYQLKNDTNLDITSVYIDVNNKVLRRRLKSRGDNKKEYTRRLKADKNDFKHLKKHVDYVVDGNTKTQFALAIEIARLVRL